MSSRTYPDRCICKLTSTDRGWEVAESHPRCPAEHEKEKEDMYDEFFTEFVEHEYGTTPENLAAEEGKRFVEKLEDAFKAGMETVTAVMDA